MQKILNKHIINKTSFKLNTAIYKGLHYTTLYIVLHVNGHFFKYMFLILFPIGQIFVFKTDSFVMVSKQLPSQNMFSASV